MNKFANIVVHLNKDNFEEAKELLLSKGEKLCPVNFNIVQKYDDANYLQLNTFDEWELYYKEKGNIEITLEDFKKFINE